VVGQGNQARKGLKKEKEGEMGGAFVALSCGKKANVVKKKEKGGLKEKFQALTLEV